MNHKFTGCLVAAVIWFGTAAVEAFSLQYSGTVYPGGEVVAGTFAPGFDVFRYNYTFGIDDVGNMDSVRYGEAVARGVFRPFGTGGVPMQEEPSTSPLRAIKPDLHPSGSLSATATWILAFARAPVRTGRCLPMVWVH